MSGEATTLELLDEIEVAKLFDVSVRTLQRWRIEGSGPAFSRIGKKPLYSPKDLRDFIERQRRTSTEAR